MEQLAVRTRFGIVGAVLTVLGIGGAPALAQDQPTFSRDVAPILYENCVSCHRPGELAPMALRSYDEVRPWARGIRDKVVSGEMSPWFAESPLGYFKNDLRLEDTEVEIISRWVDAGAPQGDPSMLPALPSFPEGWQLGEPDLVVTLPRVDVPAEGPDYYPDLSHTARWPITR